MGLTLRERVRAGFQGLKAIQRTRASSVASSQRKQPPRGGLAGGIPASTRASSAGNPCACRGAQATTSPTAGAPATPRL